MNRARGAASRGSRCRRIRGITLCAMGFFGCFWGWHRIKGGVGPWFFLFVVFSPPLQGEGWVGMVLVGCPSLCLSLYAARKPTHFPVSLTGHPGRRVTFCDSGHPALRPSGRLRRSRRSCGAVLVQEKVTKENTPSRSRFAGHPCPANFARALRRFADSTSMYRQRTRALRARAPAGFFLRALAAAERDPWKKQSAAVPAAEAVG